MGNCLSSGSGGFDENFGTKIRNPRTYSVQIPLEMTCFLVFFWRSPDVPPLEKKNFPFMNGFL